MLNDSKDWGRFRNLDDYNSPVKTLKDDPDYWEESEEESD